MKKYETFKGIIYNVCMSSSNEAFYVLIDNNRYLVRVKRFKNQKCVRARFMNGEFIVTANVNLSLELIKQTFIKNIDFRKLLRTEQKSPFRDDGVYILGEFIKSDDGFIKVFKKNVIFKDKKLFYKAIKKDVLKLFTERVEYYSKKMKIKDLYNVRLKEVSSIYGSNSIKTHSITLNISLIHHSLGEIDSVVVHELAHDKYRDHSNKFYDYVKKYYPDYDYWDNKLRTRFK